MNIEIPAAKTKFEGKYIASGAAKIWEGQLVPPVLSKLWLLVSQPFFISLQDNDKGVPIMCERSHKYC